MIISQVIIPQTACLHHDSWIPSIHSSCFGGISSSQGQGEIFLCLLLLSPWRPLVAQRGTAIPAVTRYVTKLNKILKLYSMRISTNKTKAMAMKEKYMRRAKIVIDDIVIEQTSSFKYLVCNISIYKMNMDLEDNVQKYNKLN
jgi:hypothetical protein